MFNNTRKICKNQKGITLISIVRLSNTNGFSICYFRSGKKPK